LKSYQYPALVRDHSKTKGAVKYVLLALATYADDAGECFPSYATLVKATRLSLATVRRAVSAIPANEMVIVEKGTATRRPSKYRIIINERSPTNYAHGDHSSTLAKDVDCSQDDHSQNGDYAHGDHSTVLMVTPNYAHGDTLTTQELPNEPTKARKRARGSSSVSSENNAHDVDPPIPDSLQVPEFLKAWNEFDDHRRKGKASRAWTAHAKTIALKKCTELGPARAVTAIENSILNGWQGIFEPKSFPKPPRPLDEAGLPPL
jgi:Helix-turn-helix domain